MNSKLLVLLVLFPMITISDCQKRTETSGRSFSPAPSLGHNSACNSDVELNDAITNKLSSENYEEGNQTSKAMLELSKKSSECRNEIVRILMQAMDQPNLN